VQPKKRKTPRRNTTATRELGVAFWNPGVSIAALRDEQNRLPAEAALEHAGQSITRQAYIACQRQGSASEEQPSTSQPAHLRGHLAVTWMRVDDGRQRALKWPSEFKDPI
jgi:hypothetical protein